GKKVWGLPHTLQIPVLSARRGLLAPSVVFRLRDAQPLVQFLLPDLTRRHVVAPRSSAQFAGQGQSAICCFVLFVVSLRMCWTSSLKLSVLRNVSDSLSLIR